MGVPSTQMSLNFERFVDVRYGSDEIQAPTPDPAIHRLLCHATLNATSNDSRGSSI